nr:ABC transporter permease [Calditrichia bacterium]NIV98722.1 ABC transporter permease [Candidatus Saccharibacteria bacterium]NIW78978.1 ABC transporter permease [Calditrichia bacterium]
EVDSQFFWLSMKSGLVFKDFIIGLIKPPCYGLLIGLVGAYHGYMITGGAVGLGRAAARTVMFTSLGVLIMDFVITKFILSIY